MATLQTIESDAVEVTTLVKAHMYIAVFTLGVITGLLIKWAL